MSSEPQDEKVARPTGSPTLLTLQLLEIMLGRHGDWGVTELATQAGLARGRVHRHLSLLAEAGYLHRDPHTHRYDTGWRLVLLGRGISERSQLLSVASPVMERLCDRVGNTIVLSQVTDSGVVVTETTSGNSTLSVSFPPGTTYAYNSSAQGKVALAFASEEQRANWGQLPFETRTSHTITDPELLWHQVSAARRCGWATAPEETFPGMNAIAAPIFDHDGTLVATVGIVAPGQVIPSDPLPEQIEAVLGAAATISTQLGRSNDALPSVLTGRII